MSNHLVKDLLTVLTKHLEPSLQPPRKKKRVGRKGWTWNIRQSHFELLNKFEEYKGSNSGRPMLSPFCQQQNISYEECKKILYYQQKWEARLMVDFENSRLTPQEFAQERCPGIPMSAFWKIVKRNI